MSSLSSNPQNSSLLTDLYQLTMAQGYWRLGRHERQACFQLFSRQHPFDGEYTICAGLNTALEYLQQWHFSSDQLSYLESIPSAAGGQLFCREFLDYLSALRFTGDIYAAPEGSYMYPQEPFLRCEAPIIQAQLLETRLINAYSLATLVATKAQRIRQAAGQDPIAEFGLRRAQGPDGGLTASRAAYLGGVNSTSNLLAGQMYAIPVVGTMAHSWIMSFPDEMSAFHAAIECMGPNNVLLIDTYNTAQGIKNAIACIEQCNARRSPNQPIQKLSAVRLDSGDLAELAKLVRAELDARGYRDTKIMASGNIDEYVIASLKQQQAPIDSWGVGTKLVTSDGQGAMDLAYKLSAIKQTDGSWRYCHKTSDSPRKRSLPGRIQVARLQDKTSGHWQGDILFEEDLGFSAPDNTTHSLLLQKYMQYGKLVQSAPSLEHSRQRVRECRYLIHPATAVHFPHHYPNVYCDQRLHHLQDCVKN